MQNLWSSLKRQNEHFLTFHLNMYYIHTGQNGKFRNAQSHEMMICKFRNRNIKNYVDTEFMEMQTAYDHKCSKCYLSCTNEINDINDIMEKWQAGEKSRKFFSALCRTSFRHLTGTMLHDSMF